MTHGDLFAGIGGFSLAAQWAGIETLWSNEIDPFCCKVLKKNFKHRIIEGDIRQIGRHNLEPVDILTGGFPCQPASIAGKRLGKDDFRWLWPEMLRVTDEVRPKFLVPENVNGIHEYLDEICSDLASIGYQTEPISIEAAGVGADQLRERYWIVAYTDSIRLQGSQLRMPENYRDGNINAEILSALSFQRTKTKDYLPKPYNIGGIDGLPNRVDRIRGLGNAIVPQVAFEIFKAMLKIF